MLVASMNSYARPAISCGLKIVTVVAIFGAAGCGGGGDGGSNDTPSNSVTFTPSAVSGRFIQGFDRTYYNVNSPVDIRVEAVFASAPPSTARPVVIARQAVFLDRTYVKQISSTRFSAVLSPDPMLLPGTYTGSLQLKLCADASCSVEYPLNGAELPYTITVDPGLQVKLFVNNQLQTQTGGAVTGTANTAFYFDVKSGSALKLDSTIPVKWTLRSGSCPQVLSGANAAVSTATSLSMTAQLDPSTPSNTYCDISIEATPDDTRQRPAAYYLTVKR